MNADVDNDRCPRCAALVRPGSQWCTLCYADLRPAPTPPAAQVAHPSASALAGDLPAGMGAGEGFDPLTAPLALLERTSVEPLPTGPASSPATVDPADVAAAQPSGWPCLRCGATVPLDDNACSACGAGFLEFGTDDSALGRLSKGGVSKQTKVFIMVGGSFGMLIVVLGLMFLLGTVF